MVVAEPVCVDGPAEVVVEVVGAVSAVARVAGSALDALAGRVGAALVVAMLAAPDAMSESPGDPVHEAATATSSAAIVAAARRRLRSSRTVPSARHGSTTSDGTHRSPVHE
ncbi:MAG: hypothetical protein IT196_02890 [Acidimicrobiales bacterium]|nr:hypothetical protein [Acidimicrobiales bacterium]